MHRAAGEFRNVMPGAGDTHDAEQDDEEAVDPAKKMVILDDEAPV